MVISTLPPKVYGEIEGRLDIVVIRPALVPPLLPSQTLDFVIKWWGDDEHSSVRLLPSNDEVKFVFNICCDIHGFHQYLEDAEKVHLEVSVSSDKPNDVPIISHHKTRKQWKDGEFIGSLVMKNIKFNSRGEYVYDGKILSKSGDICGSSVIFILYTSKINKDDNIINFEYADEEHSVSDITHPGLAKDFVNAANSSSENLYVPPTLSTNGNVSHSKILSSPVSFNKKTKGDRIKKLKYENEQVPFNCASDASYISDAELQKYLPDRSFLLNRLFSFVDSGAIQLADVPTLLQICQGGSVPSPDISCDDFSMNFSPKFTSNLNFTKETIYPNKKCNYGKRISEINLPGTLLESESLSCSSANKPSFNNSSQKNQSNKKYNVSTNKSPVCEKVGIQKVIHASGVLNSPNFKADTSDELAPMKLEDPLKRDDVSLIIINIVNVSLCPFESKEASAKTNLKLDSSKLNKFGKKTAVRQRSKVCYFLQISISNLNSGEKSTALFVSRQIDDGVVVYNVKEIMPLPSNCSTKEVNGYMKIRVIRRKLGERLGMELGMGFVSLRDLYEIREEVANLQLWLPSKEHHREPHKFIGKLHFKVSFALVPYTEFALRSEFVGTKYDSRVPKSDISSLGCNKGRISSLEIPNPYFLDSNAGNCIPLLQHFDENYNLEYNMNTPANCSENTKDLPLKTNMMINELGNENKLCYREIGYANSSDKHHHLGVVRTLNENELAERHQHLQQVRTTDSVPSDKHQHLGDVETSNKNRFCDKHPPLDVAGTVNNNKLFEKQPVSCCNSRCDPAEKCSITNENIGSPQNNLLPFQDYSEDCRSKKDPKKRDQEYYFTKPNISPEMNSKSPFLFADEIHSISPKRVILLEILEGHNFPTLLSTGTDAAVAPNAYVKLPFPVSECRTNVIQNSVSPEWNFKTVLCLCVEDLKQNNDHFLLLVLHCLNGSSPSSDDPILGFVALDIHLLWTRFISLSGWVPVLHNTGRICGELNISLTSLTDEETANVSHECMQEILVNNNESLQDGAADSKEPSLNMATNCKESSTQTSIVWCDVRHSDRDAFSGHQRPNFNENKGNFFSNEESPVDYHKCLSSTESSFAIRGQELSYERVPSSVKESRGNKLKKSENPQQSIIRENSFSHQKEMYSNNKFKNDTFYQSEYFEDRVPEIDSTTFIIKRDYEDTLNELQSLNLESKETVSSPAPKDSGECVIYNKGQNNNIEQTRNLPNGELVMTNRPDSKSESIMARSEKFARIPVTAKPSVVEAFTWMNQLENMDSPCTSYIDSKPSGELSSQIWFKDKSKDALPSITEADSTKRKRIKCRIAANINMPQFVEL